MCSKSLGSSDSFWLGSGSLALPVCPRLPMPWLLGDILPAATEASINSKIAATQKAQQAENELATAEAEGKKIVALAEAEARANTVRQQSVTPQLLQLEAIKKWNGVLPQVAGGATPFINLK